MCMIDDFASVTLYRKENGNEIEGRRGDKGNIKEKSSSRHGERESNTSHHLRTHTYRSGNHIIIRLFFLMSAIKKSTMLQYVACTVQTHFVYPASVTHFEWLKLLLINPIKLPNAIKWKTENRNQRSDTHHTQTQTEFLLNIAIMSSQCTNDFIQIHYVCSVRAAAKM